MCHTCYRRWRYRQNGYGRFESVYVDPAPVRAHVLELLDRQMSALAVAAAAGVSVFAVRTLFSGRSRSSAPSKRMHREVAEKLLAVPVPPPGAVVDAVLDGQQVDVTGTRRRLQALIAIGHNQIDLDDRLGWPRGTVNHVVSGRRRMVTARRHREASALFAQLQLVQGPSSRARTAALQHRWASPFQWEEETIDDPDARPLPRRGVLRDVA
ncbi:hypothetical protein Br6_04814 [Rhodococcus sp. Br-6]|nr:hypothetical protein Br6_04814 [Rhodococcus sp. Br-6]